MSEPAVAIVVPARNEAANLAELLPEIESVLVGREHEIILVDDGSTDDTPALVTRLAIGLPSLRSVRHAKPLGKSSAIWTGVLAARAPLVITLDGDGQNDPRFIPDLIAPFADARVGLVAGQRVGRKGSYAKKVASRVANRLRRALLHDDTRDTACGVKAFRRGAFLRLPFFETAHRFLPALFICDGWDVAHLDVADRPRHHGTSHYGILDRLAVGIPDLFGVWWLLRRRRRNPFRVEHEAK
jgi:glycosyltransferase involved in cell wall biosynthesis